jgi:hypothetical protein
MADEAVFIRRTRDGIIIWKDSSSITAEKHLNKSHPLYGRVVSPIVKLGESEEAAIQKVRDYIKSALENIKRLQERDER